MNMVLSRKYFALVVATIIALCFTVALANSGFNSAKSTVQLNNLEQLAGPQDGTGG